MPLRVLDLFSGIGAFSLGLERAGMRTVAFCECDPYARRVLAKHWPEVPCYDDVRTLTAERLEADGISVDVICGGFPCQDISVAGRGAGIGGERSGLWQEFARLIGELRPSYVIVENVAALLGRGMGAVLGDLSALGYDAEWSIVSAAEMGAPHLRERVWIVAYPGSEGRREVVRRTHGDEAADGPQHLFVADRDGAQRDVAYPERKWVRGCGHPGATGASRGMQGEARQRERVRVDAQSGGADVADAARVQPGREEQRAERERVGEGGQSGDVALPSRERLPVGIGEAGERTHPAACGSGWWLAEPDVGRVAHGVARRVDRLRCLGNSLVPQIPEMIGRAICRE